ncbi:hypothetical protein SK128_015863 [Halocaridina rubra]|uniref:Uncharacterized protein n=1 Tax=Halocaridina rubra TaxID=373956 RepID=A0AAN8WJH9_HALRR
MTSVNDGHHGVGEEPQRDALNISESHEAMEMNADDGFRSIRSPVHADSAQLVNNVGINKTLDLSVDSSLPSPDSAIGITPGLTPDLDVPPNHLHCADR